MPAPANTLPAALTSTMTIGPRTLTGWSNRVPAPYWITTPSNVVTDWYGYGHDSHFVPGNTTEAGDGSLTLAGQVNLGTGIHSGAVASWGEGFAQQPIVVGDYVQLAARMTASHALFYAIWLFPRRCARLEPGVTDPFTPEIDIFENLVADDFTHYQSGTHFAGGTGGLVSCDWSQWHLYGAHIKSTQVDFYLDGTLVVSRAPNWDGINVEFTMMLNHALGSIYAGSCDGTTTTPSALETGPVQVWSPKPRQVFRFNGGA